jgi:hypothetical protein
VSLIPSQHHGWKRRAWSPRSEDALFYGDGRLK